MTQLTNRELQLGEKQFYKVQSEKFFDNTKKSFLLLKDFYIKDYYQSVKVSRSEFFRTIFAEL